MSSLQGQEPFRSKHYLEKSNKASQDVGRGFIAEINQMLGHDPMVPVWASLSPVQRNGILAVAGMSLDACHADWGKFAGTQKMRLRATLRRFASLSEKIQRAAL